MKNKIIVISIIVALAIAVSIGFYFVKNNKPSVNPSGNTAQQTPAGNQEEINNSASQSKLVTDDFDIILPAGWRKTEPAIGTSAMAVNVNEQLNDPAAQKANFRSYFAVSYDTLQGKSMTEYMQIIKNTLLQTLPGVVFANEQNTTINNRSARAMEADLTQQGVNYKILMVAVAGEGEDVWVISFNTTKSSWDGYKETFSDIARSFNLKK